MKSITQVDRSCEGVRTPANIRWNRGPRPEGRGYSPSLQPGDSKTSTNPRNGFSRFAVSGQLESIATLQKVAMCSLLSLWFLSVSFSQTEDRYPSFEDSINELVSFFSPFVFPKVIQDD